MLCNNLEGWDVVGSGKEAQDGEEICVYMAESLVLWTKPTVQSTYFAIKKTKKSSSIYGKQNLQKVGIQ